MDIPENSFDVYDLAALAYIYKRMKETDPVREASHVVIDEAQDFGMMAYCCLHYCLRGVHLYDHGRYVPEHSLSIRIK